MQRPLPDRTSLLWYCARLPSRCASVSPPPGHVLRGRGPVTACDCGAFVHELAPPCGAFFWLMRLSHLGLIPLKPRVLIQEGVWRIANRFGIHDLFVVYFPRIRLTQIAHAFGLRIHHHEVLVTMRFVLAAVVQG